MVFTSYAQNFEDVILWRALSHVERGFYVDIGARHPIIGSVSLAFYEHGWRGVHLDPTGQYADMLRAMRQNEEVIEGTAAAALTISAPPLSEILNRYRDREIHWLKIDTEGMEAQFIANWPPSDVRPWIVVIKSIKSISPEPYDPAWEPLLVALGYDFVYFDGMNRFYVSRNHIDLKRHFGPGPNVFDDFVLSTSSSFCAEISKELVSQLKQVAACRGEVARLSRKVDELTAQSAAQTEAFAKAVIYWEKTRAAMNHELAQRSRTIENLASRIQEMEAQIEWLYSPPSRRNSSLSRSAQRLAKRFLARLGSWFRFKAGFRRLRTAGPERAAIGGRILGWFRRRRGGTPAPSINNAPTPVVEAEKPQNDGAGGEV
jgi:hypothetical protein